MGSPSSKPSTPVQTVPPERGAFRSTGRLGDEEARAASKLLMNAGLHGYKCAIDAAVAEAALRQHRPVVMLTSDIDDLAKLCGERVLLVAV